MGSGCSGSKVIPREEGDGSEVQDLQRRSSESEEEGMIWITGIGYVDKYDCDGITNSCFSKQSKQTENQSRIDTSLSDSKASNDPMSSQTEEEGARIFITGRGYVDQEDCTKNDNSSYKQRKRTKNQSGIVISTKNEGANDPRISPQSDEERGRIFITRRGYVDQEDCKKNENTCYKQRKRTTNQDRNVSTENEATCDPRSPLSEDESGRIFITGRDYEDHDGPYKVDSISYKQIKQTNNEKHSGIVKGRGERFFADRKEGNGTEYSSCKQTKQKPIKIQRKSGYYDGSTQSEEEVDKQAKQTDMQNKIGSKSTYFGSTQSVDEDGRIFITGRGYIVVDGGSPECVFRSLEGGGKPKQNKCRRSQNETVGAKCIETEWKAGHIETYPGHIEKSMTSATDVDKTLCLHSEEAQQNESSEFISGRQSHKSSSSFVLNNKAKQLFVEDNLSGLDSVGQYGETLSCHSHWQEAQRSSVYEKRNVEPELQHEVSYDYSWLKVQFKT